MSPSLGQKECWVVPHLVLCPTPSPLNRGHFSLFEHRRGMSVTVAFVSLANVWLCQEDKSCPPSTRLACEPVSSLYAAPHQRGIEWAEGCCRGNAWVLDAWHECVSPLVTRTVRSISMLGEWRHRGFSSPGAFPWPWNVEGHSSYFSLFSSASLIADASPGRSNLFMHFSSLTVCLKPFLEWWEMSRTFWAQSLQDQAPVWGPERREM